MRRRAAAVAGLAVFALAGCGSSSTTSSGSYGKGASAATADRTINLQVQPTSFSPAAISVKPGETVLFKVANTTAGIHEFVLGDQKAQDDYEGLMKSMGNAPMMMPGRTNIMDMGPGQTGQLAWTFPATKGATVIFGSHEPGDFARGLKGLITVS